LLLRGGVYLAASFASANSSASIYKGTTLLDSSASTRSLVLLKGGGKGLSKWLLVYNLLV
jgi:hypothetical protein